MKNFPFDHDRPSWLPDWRDESKYTDHGDDLTAWAWECLRRNPEYQTDYQHYMSLPWFYPEGGKTPKRADRSPGDDAEMLYLHGPFQALPGETKRKYETRTGEIPIPLEAYLLDKWGVLTLEDPAKRAVPAIGLDLQDSMPPYSVSFTEGYLDCGPRLKQMAGEYEWMAGRMMLATWPAESDPFIHSFGIDLRYNIKDQLETLRLSLEEMQAEAKQAAPDDCLMIGPITVKKRTNTKDSDVLLSDLRILDGLWSGATRTDIGDILWGPPKKPPFDDGGQNEVSVRRKYSKNIDAAMARIRPLIIDRGYLEMMKWALLDRDERNLSKRKQKKKGQS